MKAFYSPAFTYDQIQELKTILKDNSELLECVKRSNAYWHDDSPIHFMSPPTPAWCDPMPNPTHIGKRVKHIKSGRIEIVTDHWFNGDDCSGTYGSQLYQFSGDLEKFGCKNNSCAHNAKEYELID